MPSKGDRVTIYAGDGVNEYARFTGIIDKTSGTIGDGFQSTIIDAYDNLAVKFSHQPLLRKMPPTTAGAALRGVGLSASYYVDAAMRRAGFNVTPPREANSVLTAHLQDSMWPEASTAALEKSAAISSTNEHMASFFAPWGTAAADFNATYRPISPRKPGTATQMTVCVAPNHAATFTMTAEYGNIGNTYGLNVSAGRTAVAKVRGVQVASLPLGDASRVTMLVKGGKVTLKTDAGATANGTSAGMSNNNMSAIVITASSDARVAGVQVSHPVTAAQEFASLGHAPNARVDATNTFLKGIMDAGPAIDKREVSELLNDISQSTLHAMWIDETGTLQFVPSLVLAQQLSSQTVTTLDDVLSLGWEDSILGARSSVTVQGRFPAISRGRRRNKTVYTGSGETMESGDESEIFIGPDSDQDWIQPDTAVEIIGNGTWGTYNTGHESYAGGHYSSDGEIATPTDTLTFSLETVGVNRYKMTHKVGYLPAGVVLNLGTSPTDPALWLNNRDEPLPVIRAFGTVDWADIEVAAQSPGGIGPALTHETGPWINNAVNREIMSRMADYLASQTAVPKPTISSLEVTYDPRRQLGDSIVLDSPTLMGVTLKALIVGVEESADKDGHTQSLAVRLVNVTSAFQTYEEYNLALPPGEITYEQWQILGPVPQTYEQLTAAD